MPSVKYLFVLTSSPKDFFCEQTLVAIASLRVHNPNAFVTLLTDDKTAETLTGPRAALKDAVDELKFLVGAYQEILGNMHNLFGDTNAVHISVDDNGYHIDKTIDGETVADVLEYVQYSPKNLVRRLEIWVAKSVKEGKITLEEGKEFISNYRAGLYGYTYLE